MKVKGKKKTRIGKVLSCKMDKTAVVTVETTTRHPLYKKIVRKSKKYKVHDGKNECQVGDVIEITEVRPLSKEKRWRLLSVVEKAE